MMLSDGNIVVRSLHMDDAQRLFEAVRESIPEVSPWLPWCHENYSIEETKQFIASRASASANGEWYSFGIFEKETDRFLGGVGLNFFNRVHQMANLGYWVRTSAAGNGVASTGAVCRAIWFGTGLHRSKSRGGTKRASQRVPTKWRDARRCAAPRALHSRRRTMRCCFRSCQRI